MPEDIYIVKELRIDRCQGESRFRLEIPDFYVQRGEFVAVVGTTGCGKSTFLDILGLVLRADQAAALEFSSPQGFRHDLMSASSRNLSRIRRELLGYVLQSGGLLEFLSVRQNILLSAKLKGGIRSRRSRLQDLATRLGIADQLSKKPGYLSGGQRQRASIARALIHEPVVILADEPTASVDQVTAKTIVQELKLLASNKGVSVIMVTHDTQLVKPPISDRVYTFKVGRSDDGTVMSRCYEASWRHQTAT